MLGNPISKLLFMSISKQVLVEKHSTGDEFDL